MFAVLNSTQAYDIIAFFFLNYLNRDLDDAMLEKEQEGKKARKRRKWKPLLVNAYIHKINVLITDNASPSLFFLFSLSFFFTNSNTEKCKESA